MIVYRITKVKYAKELSGTGAYLAGGRWNSIGTSMVYTSENRALCLVELAVHIPYGSMPDDYKILTIEIPDTISIQTINENDLPPDWKSYPYAKSTQKLGDEFVKSNTGLIMKVPSAVVKGNFNFLLNPAHAEMEKVKIKESERIDFDARLFS